MAYTNTRFEVIAVKGEEKKLIGHTARVSKIGLVLLLQKRGQFIIDLTNMQEHDPMPITTKPRIQATINGWVIGFNGYTQKHPSGI